MTNREFAASYFDQARAVRREMAEHHKGGEWHLVVRRAQEVAELILKGFLRRAAVEVPRLHDVSGVLIQEKSRLPKRIIKHLPEIVSISRRLRQERETSFYGDEEQELPASALYCQSDAEGAMKDVDWLLGLNE